MNIKMVSVIIIMGASVSLFFFFKKSPLISEKQPQQIDLEIIEPKKSPTEESTTKDTSSNQTCHTEIQTTQELSKALTTQRPLVMKFYANWCGACNYVNGFYEDLAQEMPGIDFYSVNVDNQELMQEVQAQNVSKEGIEYLPTFVVMDPGKVHTQFTGGKPKEEMKATINQLLEN